MGGFSTISPDVSMVMKVATETETIGISGFTGTTISVLNGAKGSYVQLIAATAKQANGLIFSAFMSSGSGFTVLFDIAIGAVGSENVLVSNLLFGLLPSGQSIVYYVPIQVPAGSRVSVRGSINGGSAVTPIITLTLME